MPSYKQTRLLVIDLLPDVKLWQWVDTDLFELVFEIGDGLFQSYQSNDTGFFADKLYQAGHFADHATALDRINQGAVS